MEKEFFDAVVSAVASKVLESNIVANEIARQVTLNKTAVERAVDIIDPTVLSASLADVIFKYMSSSRYGQFTDTATTTYSETMKMAKDKASTILAEKMTADAMGIH